MVLDFRLDLRSGPRHGEDVHSLPVLAFLHREEMAHRVLRDHGTEYGRDHLRGRCDHFLM